MCHLFSSIQWYLMWTKSFVTSPSNCLWLWWQFSGCQLHFSCCSHISFVQFFSSVWSVNSWTSDACINFSNHDFLWFQVISSHQVNKPKKTFINFSSSFANPSCSLFAGFALALRASSSSSSPLVGSPFRRVGSVRTRSSSSLPPPPLRSELNADRLAVTLHPSRSSSFGFFAASECDRGTLGYRRGTLSSPVSLHSAFFLPSFQKL